jgi:hypothetical protein
MSIIISELLHLALSVITIVGFFSVLASLIPQRFENYFLNGVGHLIHFIAFNFWHAGSK